MQEEEMTLLSINCLSLGFVGLGDGVYFILDEDVDFRDIIEDYERGEWDEEE